MRPCDLASNFSEGVLQRLNAAGFDIYSSLASKLDEFKAIIGIDCSFGGSPEESVSNAMGFWLCQDYFRLIPPTWRAFLKLLADLDLRELSQQIEMYLTSTSSCKCHLAC